MDRPYGKVFAVTYLLAWPALGVGLVTAIAVHLVGFCIAGSAVVILVVLANLLAHRLPDRGKPGFLGGMTGYQIQWYRLVLGQEAPRALSIIRSRVR